MAADDAVDFAVAGALAVGVLLQSGESGRVRVWLGRVLAVAVAVLGVAILAEYATGMAFGSTMCGSPTRCAPVHRRGPPPEPADRHLARRARGGGHVIAVGRRWMSALWLVGITSAVVIASVSLMAYLFEAKTLVYDGPSTGMAVSTAVALLAMAASLSTARPDRLPLRWLLARHDRAALLRLYGLGSDFRFWWRCCD